MELILLAANLKTVISVAKQSLRMKSLSRNKKHKSKKWYDEQLYMKRRDLNRNASNMFKNPFIRSLRDSYFRCYRQYCKLVKYKKYTQTVILQLHDLESKDPKTYWQLVNFSSPEPKAQS